MARVSLQNLIPGSNKLLGIYRGVVEMNNDPDKRGRCKVRIFGIHTHIKDPVSTQGISTDHLPWCEPALSTFGGAITGVGMFTVPVQGSHVFVFFENGNLNAPRYFATSPGVPTKKADPNVGFSDPDGNFPREELLGKPDWNELARGESTSSTSIVKIKKEGLDTGVSTADNESWDEPEITRDTEYPYSTVIATQSDLVLELDGTPEKARFHIYHPSNSYLEFGPEGELVLRNAKSRYDIIGTDTEDHYYIHVKGKADITIDGDSTRLVQGEETELYVKEKKSYVADKETKVVKADQNVSVQGSGKYLVTGSQTISALGSQSISCTGNQTISSKGMTTFMSMGMRRLSTQGLETKGVMGASIDSSLPPKKVGGSVTIIGSSPVGSVINSTTSTLSGIPAAISDALQPMMNALKTIQTEIADKIADAASFINEQLAPITEFVGQVNTYAQQIRTEIQYMQSVYNNVTTAPFAIISAISTYANKLMSFPGQLVQTTVNNLEGLPSSLNVFRSLSDLYSTGNDIYGQVTSMADKISQLGTLYSNMGDYFQNPIDQYSRTGQFSYSDETVTFGGFGNYYINASDTGGVTSYSSQYGTGTFESEIGEMQQYTADVLTSSGFDPSGTFVIDGIINSAFEQHEATILGRFRTIPTIYNFLNPGTAMYNGVPMIDTPALSASPNGLLMDTNVTSAGYLTEPELQYTIAQLGIFPRITHELRVRMWPAYDSIFTLNEITSAGLANLYPSDVEEINEAFGQDMGTYTVSDVLDTCVSIETLELIEAGFVTYTTPYVHAFSERLKHTVKEVFNTIMALEQELLPIIYQISGATPMWDGKYEEWLGLVGPDGEFPEIP